LLLRPLRLLLSLLLLRLLLLRLLLRILRWLLRLLLRLLRYKSREGVCCHVDSRRRRWRRLLSK
jgi:hypothetical protein